MKKAIFPGTFDPFTLGHHSIVKRTLTFMDEVIIGIGINENKRCLLPIEKRLEGIKKLYEDEPKVKVMAYSGLTVDFAQEQGAEFIVRGIETIFLFTEPELTSVSSSVVRELLHYGKDVSAFLPEGMEI